MRCPTPRPYAGGAKTALEGSGSSGRPTGSSKSGAPTLKNPGNLNNYYGLPLTLLSREAEHERLVVELGMNHRGEIAELARIAQPGIGAITNIGTAHIEYLGSRDAIAAEKGDLLAALPADGTAVLPGEDDYAQALAKRSRAPVLRFGPGPGNDVCAEQIRPFVPAAADGKPGFVTLGTDGYGRSDSRQRLRYFFEVSDQFVVIATLKALADRGEVPATTVQTAMQKFGIDPEKPNPVSQ